MGTRSYTGGLFPSLFSNEILLLGVLDAFQNLLIARGQTSQRVKAVKGSPSLRKPSVPEMGPGAMALTLTPLGPHSTARCLVMASADEQEAKRLKGVSRTAWGEALSPFAALAEPACTWRPCPRYPSVAEMLTMLPPWFLFKAQVFGESLAHS